MLNCKGFRRDLSQPILGYHTSLDSTQWRSWLRYCATSRKVLGSIPSGVIGIFLWQCFWPHYDPGVDSACNRISTRNISWGVKVAGVYGWQPYHLHVLIVLKSGSLNLLEPPGPVQACNGIALLVLTGIIEIWTKKYQDWRRSDHLTADFVHQEVCRRLLLRK